MGLLKDKEKKRLKKLFKDIKEDVRLVVFTQETECELCRIAREISEEVAGLSDRISIDVKDFVADAELAKSYGVDRIPAIIIEGEVDYGIRFFGIPGGYEFTSFVQSIISVGKRDPGLDEKILKELDKIDKPVHIQVMILMTCPNCPVAVHTAHRFAMANEKIRADMVDSNEFIDLAVKYHVHGVPKVVINGEHSFVGAAPEMEFAKEILKAIGRDKVSGEAKDEK